MKKIFILLLISGVLYARKTEIIQTYDEFTDQTDYSLQCIEIEEDVLLNIHCFFFGKNLDDLFGVYLIFSFYNDKRKYSKFTTIYFLLDKERYNFECDDYQYYIYKSVYTEFIDFCSNLIFLQKMAGAKKVKFKIINDVFEMDESDLDWIKKYIEKLK